MVTAEYGAAVEFLNRRFGGMLRHRYKTVGILGTATPIVDFYGDRVGLVMGNTGAATIYVAPDNALSAYHGFTLAAQGGIVGFTVDVDNLFPCLPWFGLTPTPAQTLYVLELYLDVRLPERRGAA